MDRVKVLRLGSGGVIPTGNYTVSIQDGKKQIGTGTDGRNFEWLGFEATHENGTKAVISVKRIYNMGAKCTLDTNDEGTGIHLDSEFKFIAKADVEKYAEKEFKDQKWTGVIRENIRQVFVHA